MHVGLGEARLRFRHMSKLISNIQLEEMSPTSVVPKMERWGCACQKQ